MTKRKKKARPVAVWRGWAIADRKTGEFCGDSDGPWTFSDRLRVKDCAGDSARIVRVTLTEEKGGRS